LQYEVFQTAATKMPKVHFHTRLTICSGGVDWQKRNVFFINNSF